MFAKYVCSGLIPILFGIAVAQAQVVQVDMSHSYWFQSGHILYTATVEKVSPVLASPCEWLYYRDMSPGETRMWTPYHVSGKTRAECDQAIKFLADGLRNRDIQREQVISSLEFSKTETESTTTDQLTENEWIQMENIKGILENLRREGERSADVERILSGTVEFIAAKFIESQSEIVDKHLANPKIVFKGNKMEIALPVDSRGRFSDKLTVDSLRGAILAQGQRYGLLAP